LNVFNVVQEKMKMINESKSISPEKCSECGSSLLLRDNKNAEIVCGNCGFVLCSEITNSGPEWRVFNPEERKRKVRVGAPQTFMLHDKGLSTKIDWRDITGFAPEKRAQLHRIRQWQQRSRVSSSTEKSLSIALSELGRIADRLNLPKNIVETSAITYRKAVNEGMVRGRSIKGMTTAAIYLACRQNKLIRSLTELSDASGVDRKVLAMNYRVLVKKMNIFVPPIRSNKHVNKLSSLLRLDGVTEGIAHKILLGAKKRKLTSGRSAKSIAAASCYIASIIAGDYRTQREVAEASNLTEVTIRNRYKEMISLLNIAISL
jgi:transcription initiation factor TFIIB